MSNVSDLVIILKESWEDMAELEAEAQSYISEGFNVVIAERGKREQADISSRNFAGVANENNKHGYRQFSIKFNDIDIINSLVELGWPVNVKTYPDDPDNPIGYMTVFVNFDNPKYLPHIKTYSKMPDGKNKENIIYPETVASLDKADINGVRIHTTLYEGTNSYNGKPYLKVYLVDMSLNIVPEKPSIFDRDKRAREAIKSFDTETGDNLPFET